MRLFFRIIIIFCLSSLFANEYEFLEKMGVDTHLGDEGINAQLQANWLRPKEKERWEVEDTFSHERKKELIASFKEIGFIDEVRPKKVVYGTCVILGATVGRIKQRLEFALKLWDEGVRFNSILFLTGERPLIQSEKERVCAETEGEAAKLLYTQSGCSWPVSFFSLPMRSNVRPTTWDTLQAMPKMEGPLLFVSSQPYVLYQDAAVQKALPSACEKETVGPKACEKSLNGAVLLDTFARYWKMSKAFS